MYISHAVMQNGENRNDHVRLKYNAKWQEQSRQPQQLSAVLLLFHPSVWTNQMNNYPELTNRSRRSQLYTTKKEYEINPQYSQPARRESKQSSCNIKSVDNSLERLVTRNFSKNKNGENKGNYCDVQLYFASLWKLLYPLEFKELMLFCSEWWSLNLIILFQRTKSVKVTSLVFLSLFSSGSRVPPKQSQSAVSMIQNHKDSFDEQVV